MASGTTCTYCKRKLSCGCQRRTASDGTQVCSSCIASYEAQLKSKKGLNKFVK